MYVYLSSLKLSPAVSALHTGFTLARTRVKYFAHLSTEDGLATTIIKSRIMMLRRCPTCGLLHFMVRASH